MEKDVPLTVETVRHVGAAITNSVPGDGRLPRCGRCVRAGRDCVREPPRQFYKASRHGVERSFSSSQTWLPLPAKGVVNFVNVAESSGAGSSADSARADRGGKNAHMNTTAAPTFFGKKATWSTPVGENPASSSPPSLSASLSQTPVSTSRAQTEPASRDVPLHPFGGNVQSGFQTAHSIREDVTIIDAGTHLPNPVRRIYLDPPTWPLQDPEEATLLQHFINQVSLFFDFCDKERHFATVVPQRVRTCSTLLSAVFALSARHLSRISTFDPTVADRHYNDCLRTLIPALNDGPSVFDETLLIIVVILRLLEEIDVPVMGADPQGHLLGAQSLARAQERVGMDSGLRQAAYWACLRQEIYMSLRDHRSIRLDLQLFRKMQAVQPGDRYSLACSATLHCAEAILFAYGDGPRSLHYDLLESNRRASDSVPQPFFCRDGCSDFPDIRYATEDQIIAAQFFSLARIVLDRNDPAHRMAMQDVRKKARQRVWFMCGVGLSNPSSPAAILIACMAIALCGDCFDDHKDRERLCFLLEFTEDKRGWPTAPIAKTLKQVWNGAG
ncbi:arca-like protein [Penicillium riverlandense]|uniref:arca-like protein n=1 Tax=Penicillium riverlandense TaxID=1903569 RepID=UPI002549253B|nr:arca-like protein [Penicillium riverlandense]KAJ5833459.1 arca-like protein [Penicillium riverlandense]